MNCHAHFQKAIIYDKQHSIVLYCIVLYCIKEVVIVAQSTATFSDLLCSPEFGY